MKREQPATLASTPLAPHDTRVLAEGQEWSLTEYICRAGPEDRPVEERHEWVTIAAVVAGTFQYHAE
jgi:AraC family transcriptional regulator